MKQTTYKRLAFFLHLLLCICASHSNAQSYTFRHYQVENGLSHNMVACSVQDTTGFLWFGTKDGLNRFDGYHFKHYDIANNGNRITPSIINCLEVDKQNTLWIGTQRGIYSFNRQEEKLIPFIDTLDAIISINFDKKNNLWFIAAGVLHKYNLQTKKLFRFSEPEYFLASSVCITPEGELWVSSLNGYLHQYNYANNSFTSFNMFAHSPPPASTWIPKIYYNGRNGIYVGTSIQGLKEFDIATLTYKDILTYNPDRTAVFVRDIEQYSTDEFWIATESGIFILNTKTNEYINLKKRFLDVYSLSDNAVYSLCKDREGGIWAGTYFGGINYYSKQNTLFQKFFPDNSATAVSGNVVREICEDNKGFLWLGTEDAGLNKFNPATGVITQFKPTGKSTDIAYSNIHGLLLNGNELWIGTFDHGLDIMDLRTEKIIKRYSYGTGKHELKSNFVVSMLKSKKDVIYIGSSNSLYKYNPQIKAFDLLDDVPSNIFISCLLEGSDNTIWVGTHNHGVFYFNPYTGARGQILNKPGSNISLMNNIVNALTEDRQHNIWISTDGGGIAMLNKEKTKLTSYTTADGLPSNFIFKALEDNDGNMWITTTRGLVQLISASKKITVYTKDNGLLNDQFNYNSGYKDSNGIMYFGSVKGMIRFHPDDFENASKIGPVYITGFQVQNEEQQIGVKNSFLKQSILYTKEIVLPHDRSSFSIDFTSLSYTSPEMTEYSYFMKGADENWTTIKPNRKVYFSNLSPGSYIFQVKASVNGMWTTDVKELKIKILPPFWATNLAYAVYSILALLLFYYLFRIYHIYNESKKRKEIYEAKIDFFTNVAHEIKTPLTLIKGPVENLMEKVDEIPVIKDDLFMMNRNTNRLVALITQILDFRKTETNSFRLDFSKVNITELLKDTFADFSAVAKKRNLDYSIELPDSDAYLYADEEALNKIFSNLVDNAVKYASQKVQIRLLPQENNKTDLTVEIENDGLAIPDDMKEKIFEPFVRLKETQKRQGTGIGLALAKSLTELHKGKLFLRISPEEHNVFVVNLPLENTAN
ncbi:sensor histidine kinase [Lacibacter luteus]|uniref:histidine kinase n=1 Tax=Lacibacter luteus TaxID=2508719 RepID=A0A4Q1CMW0_9BACT|nr:sensor histidine kinase [Lacibacter luteus]RXK62031.1 sensor histidine kinase [Lacibacter luteus]